MAQINCYIPIKLRIVGELNDAQLEQLGQTLVRTLQARIAFAERSLAARYNLTDWGGASESRETYDPAYADGADATYQIPSYNGGGQRVSMRLAEPAPKGVRPWIIRIAINFHATVGEFLDFVESLDPTRTLDDKVLYIDIWDQLRWVSLWLVQVNQDYTLSDLEQVLAARAMQLSKLRDNQILAYGLGTTENIRQQLIELDQDRRVAHEIPEIGKYNVQCVYGSGPDSDIYAGGWVLFASMVLPKIELVDVATPGLLIEIALKLRDLAFLVPAELFEQNYALTWAAYVQEWGDRAVTLRLQPVSVVKKVHPLSLQYLTEQMVLKDLRSAPNAPSASDSYFGRLFVLNSATIDKFPGAARSQVNMLSDETTRQLDDLAVAGDLSPNWKAAFAFVVLTIDEESLGAARYHPQARHLLPLLLAKLSGDESEYNWQLELQRFLRDTFGSDPPATRPGGGSVFEYLLVELEAHNQLSMLFDKVEASGHFELLHLLVQLAMSTRYASHQRVQQAYQRLNQRSLAGWEHTYRIKEQEIWLKHDSDQVVRKGDILAEANSIYSLVKEQKRLKEASIPKMRKALAAEGQELLKRILLGQDKTQYSDEAFALAAFNEVRNNAQKYDISNSDFETVTIERTVRLLGIETHVEAALERIYVTYEFVEREKGKPWSSAETVPNSRVTVFIGSPHGWADNPMGFELMLWFWEFNKAAVVVEYFAIGVSALAVIAVAWEVGIIAGAVELAGGWTVVGISIGISELFYAYRVIFKGEEFTWRGFFMAALDGYLTALTFRGAGLLGKGLAGKITTDSVSGAVIKWIGEKLTVGIVGGATSAALTTFSHDLLSIAMGEGGFSSFGTYVHNMTLGAALGIAIEVVGVPLLSSLGKTALAGLNEARELARLIRAEGLDAVRWSRLLEESLDSIKLRLSTIIDDVATQGFVKAMKERLSALTEELKLLPPVKESPTASGAAEDEGGLGLFGKKSPPPSGPISAELKQAYLKQLESKWFRTKLRAYARLTGKGEIAWNDLAKMVEGAEFREYASAWEAAQSVGYAGKSGDQLVMGMSKAMRKLPILGDSAMQHEIVHVYQEMVSQTISKEAAKNLPYLQLLKAEVAAQVFGSPAVILTYTGLVVVVVSGAVYVILK